MSNELKIENDSFMPQGVVIGGHEYFTIQQLQEAIQQTFGIEVPLYHFKSLVRSGAFGGQKIGKVYMVSGEDFRKWVSEGHFEYKARKRKVA